MAEDYTFFRYRCSKNDGLVTLVTPDDPHLSKYEERDCETLDGILFFEVEEND